MLILILLNRATHSEIEKRRRQKMNKHLNELVFNLPVTSSKNKKPDKITILKMAVQHMKNLKASTSILSDSFLCQNYITPIELQSLVLKESNEFLFVIRCDSGKILYASESCYNSIGFLPSELVDKVFFEIVHPSDTKQVKDQLVYHDMTISKFYL
jgi:aryl hydrocarbon receptor nuclear translocator